MSVVIVGGNECMERKYLSICQAHGHSAKVFTRPSVALRTAMGAPDLVIVFTSTVSHTMVRSALGALKGEKARIERSHSASASALSGILARYA